MRTFIAIELDESIRRTLGEVRKNSRIRDRSVRWVKPGSIHLTLKFLGEIEPEAIPEVSASMERAALGIAPFTISVGGFGCFPGPRNPRVLWVGVDEPTRSMASLQAAVEEECGAIGFKRERRAFKPHLTLARVRGRIGPIEIDDLGEPGSLGEQDVASITLFQSELKPSGAVYVPLATIPLQGA